MNWIRVTRQHKCPICEKPDWCSYSDDGRLAVCMRVPSDRQTRNGGYMHRLTDEPRYFPPLPVRRSPPPRRVLNFDYMLSRWKAETAPNELHGLATRLGVSASVLVDLGATWAATHGAWAFPMRDGNGKVVGVRLRADDGRKWAVKGSREGLFYPERVPVDHVAVVCEGPTDTAAALTLGLWAVGRPSCMGGVDLLHALCARLLITHLIIIPDNDAPKRRPGGWWQPGIDGARRMIQAVRLPYKLCVPQAKDIRAWVQAGATRNDFDYLTEQQAWRFSA